MQVNKQQLEPDMEQQTGSKLEKENVKAVNCHHVYLTYMQSERKWKWKWSCSVMPDSLRPHGLQPTSLLGPWDFPGKSTGVGCHRLLRIYMLLYQFVPPSPSPCSHVHSLPDKGLISRIFKEVSQLNNKKWTSIQKWTKNLNRYFSKADIQLVKEAHAKMLTIPNCWVNINPNDSEMPLHTYLPGSKDDYED